MIEVAAAGIDTWSPCWWLEPGSVAARHLAALCERGLYPEPIAGHRVGFYSHGLLWAEGHPGGDRLGRPADLPGALDRLARELLEAGVPLPVGRRGVDLYGERSEGFAGVRRLDSTVDLRTSSSAEGLAFLAGIAGVARELPRSKANVWFGGDGRVQTVGLHGHAGGRLLGRVYDKGVETGEAARGRWLRPEDQRRWGKGYRRDVDELTGHYVRQMFSRRFVPLWRATKGVTVAGVPVLKTKLMELLDAGDLTARQVEQLGGYLLFGDELPVSRATRMRRRAQLREYGLVLADGVLQEVEVDLGEILEATLETDAWERRA